MVSDLVTLETAFLTLPENWSFEDSSGTPLQCSCLENPMDRGAWWAAVYRVAELDTTEVI